MVLVAFLSVYGVLHLVLAFPVWDRYLLPLVVVAAILTSRGARVAAGWVENATSRWRLDGRVRTCARHLAPSRTAILVVAGIAALLATFTFWPALADSPVGGDLGASTGIDLVAGYVADRPDGTVLYHHWQGWHLRYYLFDALVYLAFWPNPAWLERDVAAFALRGPRYIAFPAGESLSRVESALKDAGFRLSRELTTHTTDGMPTFSLHQIVPLGQP
jgi:hypothetical protein